MIQPQLEKNIVQGIRIQCRDLKLIRQIPNSLQHGMIRCLLLFIHMIVVILFHLSPVS